MYIPAKRVEMYNELKVWLLLAVEQARLDVVSGVTDNSVGDDRKAGIRSDALAFMVDGRLETLLEFSGVSSRASPNGVDFWIRAMGAWARNRRGCPPAATDTEAIIWGHEHGEFDNNEAWEQAEMQWMSVCKRVNRIET